MTDNHTETLRESSSESPNTSAIVPDTRVSIKRDDSQSGQPQSADYTQEIRFAVVMYGGVSLAVYINGVSQELLRMVRATAQVKADGDGTAGLAPIKADKLTGSERVYRKVSYLLSDSGMSAEKLESVLRQNRQLQTRFVIDILSGTSAGGINGVFLAKALANGQSLDKLQELWIEQGDIDSLLNDKRSIEPPLTLSKSPASLLNSNRMYLELLKAFNGMEENGSGVKSQRRTGYVDEIDLYVTATDLQGVALPMRLSNELVYERRHRNVLHFIYSKSDVSGEQEDRNDFLREYNPFLAYASRCTSSFPFAFEPMCLCDTDHVIEGLSEYRNVENCKSDSKLWQPFYKDYLDPRGVSTVPFPQRAFGDGGYLDNKPFTYAIDTLTSRHADVPVTRKLLYIEPSPKHPEDKQETQRKPDALESVRDVFTLPRDETIREDLQRVAERNRMVQRVNRIMNGVERDTERVIETTPKELRGQLTPQATDGNALWARDVLTDEEWATLDLTDMIKRKGRGYVAYHRLEIATLTDQLAELVARVAGFDEESEYFMVVRSLVRAWRDRKYIEHRANPADQQPTMNRFLHEFDLSYPLRRLNFLLMKSDQLYRLDEEAHGIVQMRDKSFWPEKSQLTNEEKRAFRAELLRLKQRFNQNYVSLRRAGRALRSRGQPAEKQQQAQPNNQPPPGAHVSPLFDEIQNLIAAIGQAVAPTVQANGEATPTPPILKYFFGKERPRGVPPSADERELATWQRTDPASIEEEAVRRAQALLNNDPRVWQLFETTAEKLKTYLDPLMSEADDDCLTMLAHPQHPIESAATSESPAQAAARECLRNYYQNYDDYDMITFPILYDTDIGEAATVEVFRVSPEDATSLINERGTGCHKLAGTALGHFGAFLDKSWRQNDILWGRLDGAERLISALLPDHPLTRQLVGEAQAAIICETIEKMGSVELSNLLVEAAMRTKSGQAEPALLEHFLDALKEYATEASLKDCLDKRIDTRQVRQHYLDTFAERSRLQPEPTLRNAARATTIIGKIFDGLSDRYNVGNKYVAWIARLGQIFWSLVEVAVPRSLPNLIFRHWLKLLYFFEVVLIVSSTLLLSRIVQQFAFMLFAITVAVHLAIAILGDIIRSRNRWLNILKAVVIVTLVALVAFGVLSALGVLGFSDSIWGKISSLHQWLHK
jgi:patatin-related protein